jgi:hypothetical protein
MAMAETTKRDILFPGPTGVYALVFTEIIKSEVCK